MHTVRTDTPNVADNVADVVGWSRYTVIVIQHTVLLTAARALFSYVLTASVSLSFFSLTIVSL